MFKVSPRSGDTLNPLSMNRCLAIKGDGEQCTRHQAANERRYCTQHAKTSKTKKVETVGTVEPWIILGFPEPDPRNGKKYIQKIRTHLNKASSFASPKSNPHSGSIYVFYLPREKGLNYYKIGYTEQTVEERMEQWAKAHPDLELLSSYFVTCNAQKYEALIHMYLAYCRLYRYPNAHGFHSVYMLSGEVIQDGQQNREDDEKPIAKSKEIEWFCAPLKEVIRIIEGILKTKK